MQSVAANDPARSLLTANRNFGSIALVASAFASFRVGESLSLRCSSAEVEQGKTS
jgi:hypothetical protein